MISDAAAAGDPTVLVLNGGSSSIRFAVFDAASPPLLRLSGKLAPVGGTVPATLRLRTPGGDAVEVPSEGGGDHRAAATGLLDAIAAHPATGRVRAIGHRLVHGMERHDPERVTPALLRELVRIVPFAREHLPREIELVRLAGRRFPGIPQVACFDTAFHRTMPAVARLLPVPRRFTDAGVRRHGFHGISFSYLMEELLRIDPASRRKRIILAHLGNGASLAAVRDGRGIDTTMGFTPTGGLMMGTRSGDLDPGVISWFARDAGMSRAAIDRMLDDGSGLLGVSGTSADMQILLGLEASDPRAKEAVDLFCHLAKRWVGAMAAVLGGIDTVVFAGGIGENAPDVRSRICDGLDFLGITIDGRRNRAGSAIISKASRPVQVRVIATDEERMIARSVMRVVGSEPPRPRR